MEYNTNHIKLLSWALLFKEVRSNSVLKKGESIGKFIKTNGLTISEATFRKYWNQALDLGLIKDYGEHKQLIDWEMFIKVSNIKLEVKYFNQILNRETETIKSFSKMCKWVYYCLIAQNFHKQEVAIKKASSKRAVAELILKSSDNKIFLKGEAKSKVKSFIKAARKSDPGMGVEVYAKRLLDGVNFNKTIVTGSLHLSNKVGISAKSANNKLNEMVKSGLTTREVVMEITKVPNNKACHLTEALRGLVKIAYTSKDGSSSVEVLGSKITLSSLLSLYPTL